MLPEFLIIELTNMIIEQMPIIAECTVLEDTVLKVRELFQDICPFKKYPYSIFLSRQNPNAVALRYFNEKNIIRFGARNSEILSKLTKEYNVDLFYSSGFENRN